MPDFNNPSFTPATIIKNLVVGAIFFFLFFISVRFTVPSEDPLTKTLVAAFVASSMAATAWIAWHMLRAVYLDEKEHRRKSN